MLRAYAKVTAASSTIQRPSPAALTAISAVAARTAAGSAHRRRRDAGPAGEARAAGTGRARSGRRLSRRAGSVAFMGTPTSAR